MTDATELTADTGLTDATELTELTTGGILSATDQGRALYLALGWTVRSDLAAARRADINP